MTTPPDYLAVFERHYGSLSDIDWGPTCEGCKQRVSCCRGLEGCPDEHESEAEDEDHA